MGSDASRLLRTPRIHLSSFANVHLEVSLAEGVEYAAARNQSHQEVQRKRESKEKTRGSRRGLIINQ